MSERAAKATSRQIRRAFGYEALHTIEQQGECLQSVVLPRLATLAKGHTGTHTRMDTLESRVDGLAGVWRDARQWTFRQRLRWLLTGVV